MGIYFLRPVTREKVFDRAGGQCECTMAVCGHAGGRCSHPLGDDWQVHDKAKRAVRVLSSVLAMCKECYERTRGE